jgi:hypothetical protein
MGSKSAEEVSNEAKVGFEKGEIALKSAEVVSTGAPGPTDGAKMMSNRAKVAGQSAEAAEE